MSNREHRATVGALKESLAVIDEAALMHMRAAQKYLRKAREVSAQLEEMKRNGQRRAAGSERAA